MKEVYVEKLKNEIQKLINTLSLEILSNTPDYVLAEYLIKCLEAFNNATKQRDKFYNIKHYCDGVDISDQTISLPEPLSTGSDSDS